MTAETLYEDLMNASSISDLMAQLEALLGKAEGLGGEQGAQFVEILKNLANNNTDLGNITSILAGLEDELFSAEAVRDNAYAMLENSKGDLEDLKAKAASLHAELDALKAEGANAIKIGLKEGEVKLADAAVAAGEFVVSQWESALDDALAVVDSIREKIDQYTEELFQKAKDYIAESEVGQAIKDLENAIAEKGWEGKKMVAEADAKVVASAEAIKDLIANYNALNQAVVDEFNDSIFGKVLSIIVSQEAEQAFAELGLTELHTALKQLPEIATMIIKYYPSGMTSLEGATALLGGLTPDVTVEWTTDYELAN
jgi:chromosome segregation ATPase